MEWRTAKRGFVVLFVFLNLGLAVYVDILAIQLGNFAIACLLAQKMGSVVLAERRHRRSDRGVL